MKRIIISYIVCLLMLPTIQAQVSKTIDLSEAGTLSTKLTSEEIKTVVNLTITGKIDARDFKFLRDSLNIRTSKDSVLNLDISNASIKPYIGKDGTLNKYSNKKDTVVSYSENSLPENSFTNNQRLRSISLPNTLVTIDKYAFAFCKLANVIIPSSVISIGDFGFNESSLINIDFPSSLKTIGNNAFSNCGGLTNIEIPFTVTTIGKFVFGKCINLNSVNIASNSIGDYTFSNCSKLKTVELQSTVTKIGDNAFSDCNSIANIIIPSNVTTIGKFAFRQCSNLKTVDFPASIKSIDNGAFSNCYSLFLIKLRSHETKISEKAFSSTALKSIYIYSTEPVQVDSSNVFDSYDYSTISLHVASGLKKSYENHKVWGKFKNISENAGLTFTIDAINYNVSGKDSVYVAHGNYLGKVNIFTTREELYNIGKQIQEDTIRETVKKCIENVYCDLIHPPNEEYPELEESEYRVVKSSILSIADKLIKEL